MKGMSSRNHNSINKCNWNRYIWVRVNKKQNGRHTINQKKNNLGIEMLYIGYLILHGHVNIYNKSL